ncbi:MAG: hypothetical protein MR964_03970 [Campylobacter sp.]|uniref:hypothetical protein n=1 Tax=Campylobacter sp. TaxID=205 RepID=UPI002AA83C88|nr:hypothetical protein [Campylobacter sp.]MCI7023370.1 hypothetical protein [Campylobacter sp.]
MNFLLRNPLDQGASRRKTGQKFCRVTGLRKALRLKAPPSGCEAKKAEPADKIK